MNFTKDQPSLNEINQTVYTGSSKKWKRLVAFLGPAYLVSVGYMDPGNWATDLQGGAQFGYQLIWVLLMSNLMALLLQNMSARLGIVRRKDLAQVNREVYPKYINFCLYILAELAIASCDLAEVLGMAIGIHLLTGLSLANGVAITILDTFLLLWLQRYGIRKLEAFIIALVVVIGISFFIEIVFAKPNIGAIAKGLIPSPIHGNALYIAIAIIGATVMPHNLYLHSALVQTREIKDNVKSIRQALRFNVIDSTIALNLAFFVNAAILIVAAAAFFSTGHTNVARIEDAHTLLAPLLGSKLAPLVFAIALIAAGQSSTVTGTLAGQIIMEGYLHLRINPVLRRLLTRLIAIVPAACCIWIYGDEKIDALLIFSQFILSLQLGFAVVPLIHFVSNKKTMGVFTIKIYVQIIAWVVAGVLIYLNVQLLWQQASDFFVQDGNIVWKIIIGLTAVFFVWLFLNTLLYPIKKTHGTNKAYLHEYPKSLHHISIPQTKHILVALDFGEHDYKVIVHALAQGNKTTTYTLLHIVESAPATLLGEVTDDLETRLDQQRLEQYATELKAMAYKVNIRLGYKTRKKEIIRAANELRVDLVVMGAHRHSGIKDFLFGETIRSVRHSLQVPLLIVNE